MTNYISPGELPKTIVNLRILVAPLDWGLGHATRCIPIINALLSKGFQVIIAADGATENLLRIEFPNLEFIQLAGYQVHYSKKWLMVQLVSQLFKIKKTIDREHSWLKQAIDKHRINWVISDNRYGLWGRIPSTIITHQLQVKLPKILNVAEKIIQKIIYKYIGNYQACWVPDLPDNKRGLSGQLGHPSKKPSIPVYYTGWLSRFSINTRQIPPVFKCLILLSGPEPQRSLLEQLLIKQLKHFVDKIILVRGLPNSNDQIDLPENITVYNHLPSREMLQAFEQSEFLISRSGYSTVMDAFTLHKKCIFIPTPGQTEQEYIGQRLASNRMALVYTQAEFNIENALAAALDFQFHFPLNTMNNLLEMAIDNFITSHFKGDVYAAL